MISAGLQTCNKDQVRNPKTKRCVKKNSPVLKKNSPRKSPKVVHKKVAAKVAAKVAVKVHDAVHDKQVSSQSREGHQIMADHQNKHPDNLHLSLAYMIAHRQLKLIQPGTLTVAAYPNFQPVSYKDKAGQFQGIDVDFMRAFAEVAGLGIRFLEFRSFDGIWEAPEDGYADVSIGGIANLESRTGPLTEWTIPQFQVDRSVIQRKNNPIRNFPSDVRRKDTPVIGTYGSTGWQDAEIRLERAGQPRSTMKRGTSDKDDLEALEHGQAQGLMRGSFVSKAIVKSHKDLAQTEWQALPELMPSDGEVFAQPCKLGSGLAIVLSTFIAEMVAKGGLVHLMKKHGLV